MAVILFRIQIIRMLNIQSLKSELDWFNQRLQDGGPVYTETNLDHFIVEPWNALSSLLIVLPAIYWMFRVRKEFRDYKFLMYCIPLMILGGSGSTLFHAFRTSTFFLVMDVLPTAILTLSITIYFWIKVLPKWWYLFYIIVPSILLRFWIFSSDDLPEFLAINLSYVMTGLLIGIPLLLIQLKTKFYKIIQVLTVILLFSGAIFFRGMDAQQINILPMGTHFLWHALTGFGAYFILYYLYYFRKKELDLREI